MPCASSAPYTPECSPELVTHVHSPTADLLTGNVPPAAVPVPCVGTTSTHTPAAVTDDSTYDTASASQQHLPLDCSHPPPPPPEDLGPTPREFAPVKAAYWPRLNSRQWASYPEYALLYSGCRSTCLPNHLGARLTVPSGFILHRWESELKDYHDIDLCSYLRYGWPVGYTAPNPPRPVHLNHTSALQHPTHIRAYIEKELRLGGLIGPFSEPPFLPWTHTAPLMTAPKRDSTDRRIIVDHTYPEGFGVNSGVTKNVLDGRLYPYSLPSVQDLVGKIRELGPRSYIWKADLARAYHQLRADPVDIPLLGFYFEGSYYAELCPSFGCRLSGSACQRTTQAVVYMMAQKGSWCLAYLDDFCGAAATLEQAQHDYKTFIDLAASLGMALSPSKCSPPTQSLEWLGFNLDTVGMILTIPTEKLTDIIEQCNVWSDAKSATKNDLQSLTGKLMHISKCIAPGRKFISRILFTLKSAPDTGRVWLSAGFKADVQWFVRYAEATNGTCLIDPPRHPYVIECDSTQVAGGANSDTHYYTTTYDKAFVDAYHDIVHKEAVNLLIAYRSLIPTASAGLHIVINTDNIGSKYALESGRTKDKILAACSRQLWLEAALHDHTIQVCHKHGKDIPLPDALSRMHEPAKARLAHRLISERGLLPTTPALPHPMFSAI